MNDGLGKVVFEKAVCGCACAMVEMGKGRPVNLNMKLCTREEYINLGEI